MQRPELPSSEGSQHPLKFYQNWKWVAALAALILGVGLAAFSIPGSISATETQTDVETLTSIGEVLADNSETNRRTLERIDRAITAVENNQTGIDELVEFVHEIQAREQAQGNRDSSQMFVELLCASSDPVRQQACARLQANEVP